MRLLTPSSTSDVTRRASVKSHRVLNNILIILDSSDTSSTASILVPPEAIWKQAFVDAKALHVGGANDLTTPIKLAPSVMRSLFNRTIYVWQSHLAGTYDYITILEEQVYSKPADDSRATELWSIGKECLRIEKHLKFNITLLEQIQADLTDIFSEHGGVSVDWLRTPLAELKEHAEIVEESIAKPARHMLDLVSLPKVVESQVADFFGIDVQVSKYSRRTAVSRVECESLAPELDHLHLFAIDFLGRFLWHERART